MKDRNKNILLGVGATAAGAATVALIAETFEHQSQQISDLKSTINAPTVEDTTFITTTPDFNALSAKATQDYFDSSSALATQSGEATQGALATRGALVDKALNPEVTATATQTLPPTTTETTVPPTETAKPPVELNPNKTFNLSGSGFSQEVQIVTPNPTPEPTVNNETNIQDLTVIPQELNENNFREGATSESKVWANVIANLSGDCLNKDQLKGTNSLLTTLSNEPRKNADGSINFDIDFGTDPKTEPGLSQTPEDWNNFRDVQAIDGNTKILDTLHLNANGMTTDGFYGRADDRDASVYYLAAAVVANRHRDAFGSVTINDLNNLNYPANYDSEISQVEDQIFGKIQIQFLGESDAEIARRQNNSDASSQIPAQFRKVDQYESCDVYELQAKERDQQVQSLVVVDHLDSPTMKNTITQSNVGAEGSMITLSIDQKGNWGVRSITNRAYSTARYGANEVYPNDAAGEQEIVCAPNIKSTATPVPGQPNQPQTETTPNQPTPPGFPTPVLPNQANTAPTWTPAIESSHVAPTFIPGSPAAPETPVQVQPTDPPAPTAINLGFSPMGGLMIASLVTREIGKKIKEVKKNMRKGNKNN